MQSLIKTHAGLLFAGVATFILMGSGQSLYGPALPAFARGYGIGLGMAGLVVSAHWVGCFAGVGVMFWRGPLVTPRVALAVMALGAAGLAAAPVWPLVLVAAAVFGAGYGLSAVMFNPRILRAFGVAGPGMMSLINACFGVGAIVAPLVFVQLGSAPGLCFALVAGLCVLVWLGSGAAGREEAVAKARRTQFRMDWVILAFGVVSIGMEASLIGLGPAALIAAGSSETAAAQWLSVFFAAFLGVRVLLIFTAHLLASFVLLMVSLGVTAAAAAGAALWHPALFFVAMGAGSSMLFQGFFVTATARMGDDPRVAPTIIAAGLVGGITVPLVLSLMFDDLGERGFFWVMACVAGTAFLASVAMRSRMMQSRG